MAILCLMYWTTLVLLPAQGATVDAAKEMAWAFSEQELDRRANDRATDITLGLFDRCTPLHDDPAPLSSFVDHRVWAMIIAEGKAYSREEADLQCGADALLTDETQAALLSRPDLVGVKMICHV